MDELHRLDDTFDSMDEAFGAPRDQFRPRGRERSPSLGGEGGGTASRLIDATVKKLWRAAILCTAEGSITAIAGLLAVILPLPPILLVLPGIPLIIAGAICGSIARRALPSPVSVSQLIWRFAPSVGAMVGADYSLVFLPRISRTAWPRPGGWSSSPWPAWARSGEASEHLGPRDCNGFRRG
jgi:hypothetical protein